MGWSFKIARIKGIDVYVHFTFLLLLFWIMLSRSNHYGVEAGLISVGLTIVTFIVVAMHEFGHALMARRFNIATRNIMLWPFGGVASLEGGTSNAKEEILVAIAGPAVNFVLAGLCLGGWNYCIAPMLAGTQSALVYYLLEFATWFFWTNVVLLGFNLIPAFPMDGGRVLRGLLNLKYDLLTATEYAVKVGRFAAAVMGFYGLYSDFMLVVIAIFIFFSGTRELEDIRMAERLRRVREGQGTIEDMLSLGMNNFGPFGRILGGMVGSAIGGNALNMNVGGLGADMMPEAGAAPSDGDQKADYEAERIVRKAASRHSAPVIDAQFVGQTEETSAPSDDDDEGMRIISIEP